VSNLRTIADVVRALPSPAGFEPLPAPEYVEELSLRRWIVPPKPVNVGLAVESMKRHMTSEGWDLFAGLQEAGWWLAGKDLPLFKESLPTGETHVAKILVDTVPTTILIQDKREWECLTADRSRDPSVRFTNVETLKSRSDIFKLTVLKDAQHNPDYHRQSAEEIGCHAWVTYYHPDVVCHLAPYLRREHLVRTYHCVDANLCCSSPEKLRRKIDECLLSGALSNHYPLRKRIVEGRDKIKGCRWLKHPGYHRRGCQTPAFLAEMNRVKVAICTSSIYSYSLRKIVEAVACGAIPITDLAVDEILPEIDGSLMRVPVGISISDLDFLVKGLYQNYNIEQRSWYAERAKKFYDWRAVGKRLSNDIEAMRRNYNRSCGDGLPDREEGGIVSPG
jgi:hypothetical protein